MGKQWAAVLVVGALFAGACGTSRANSSGESPGHPGVVLTTPTTRRAPTTSTPTTIPAYSFDDSVPPPKLINTGTNYVAILKSLQAYGDWTTSHRPDRRLVDRFVARGTQLSTAYSRTLTILGKKSQRLFELRQGDDVVTIVSSTSDAISARLTQQISLHRIVDARGATVDEARFSGSTTYAVLAVRTLGRWYLASMTVSSAPRPVS